MLILLLREANKGLFLCLRMFRYVYHWLPCTYQADNKLQPKVRRRMSGVKQSTSSSKFEIKL